MLSKWEWIAEKLRELGYTILAQRADKIEKTLKSLYGVTVTNCWAQDWKHWDDRFNQVVSQVDPQVSSIRYVRLDIIADVAQRPDNCIACVQTSLVRPRPTCAECLFAIKVGGTCGIDTNPYNRFIAWLMRAKVDACCKEFLHAKAPVAQQTS